MDSRLSSKSIELDDSDVEERTPDRRYTRAATHAGPVYSIRVGALQWCCYEAFDEEDGLECNWHKVTVVPREGSSASSERNTLLEAGGPVDAATAGRALDATMRMLEEWKHYSHDLLLDIKLVWRSDSGIEVVAAFSGAQDLNSYLCMHQHLGEPAIRKIARQVLKAMIALQRHTHCPAHLVTAADIYIKAGNGRIVVLPTFAWRTLRSGPLITTLDHEAAEQAAVQAALPVAHERPEQPSGGSASGNGAAAERLSHRLHQLGPSPLRTSFHQAAAADPCAQCTDAPRAYQSCVLEAWARIVLDLYLRSPEVATWSAERMQAELRNDAIHPDALAILEMCLDEEQSRMLPLVELLDHAWLNTRQCLAFQHTGPEPLSVQHVSLTDAFGLGKRESVKSMPSWRFSAVDSEQAQAGVFEAAEDILTSAKSAEASAVSASVLTGDEFRIAATGTFDEEAAAVMFTMKLTRLDQHATQDTESYKVLSFPYDVYHDTVDVVATEMKQQFGLSTTDTELVASAMREVIALLLPGLENMMSVQSSLASSLRVGSQSSLSLGQSGLVPPSIMTLARRASHDTD